MEFGKKTSEILDHSITLFGCCLSQLIYEKQGNIRNQYCPEGISKANWRISLATLMNHASRALFPFIDLKGKNLSYSNWAKIVREYVPLLFANLPIKPNIEENQVKIIAEHGLGSIEVANNVLKYKSGSKIRTTTIHNVKGETLDTVLVVSSLDRKSKGGHWKDWFNSSTETEDEEEHKRYGFVALSRPKHLLVLAAPKLNSEDRTLFTGYGFQIENLKTEPLF